MRNLQPAFFDIFGALGFLYISIIAGLALLGRHLPKWVFFVLLLIGLIGLGTDSLIVYTFFIRPG